MIVPNNVDIETVFDDNAVVAEALNRGVREALRRHKLLGQSIAVWRNGKAVVIPADEIRLNDDAELPRPIA